MASEDMCAFWLCFPSDLIFLVSLNGLSLTKEYDNADCFPSCLPRYHSSDSVLPLANIYFFLFPPLSNLNLSFFTLHQQPTT